MLLQYIYLYVTIVLKKTGDLKNPRGIMRRINRQMYQNDMLLSAEAKTVWFWNSSAIKAEDPYRFSTLEFPEAVDAAATAAKG